MSVATDERTRSPVQSEPTVWSQMPVVPAKAAVSRLALTARQLILGAIVALALWLLGRHGASVAVMIVTLLAITVCAVSPRAAEVVARFVLKFQSIVGRALSYLLLGLIELVVFTPIAAVSWLIRRDPLAMGHRRSDPSLWRAHAAQGRRSLHTRQFTYEWPARSASHRSLLGRLAFVIGAIVLLMACDLGVGAGVTALQGTTAPTKTPLFSHSIAAIPRTTWWPTVLADTFSIATTARPDPFLGWTFSNYSGSPYTNIADGVRRSYEPPVAPGRRAVEVLFLGGSTVAGSYQRDDFTIPSDVARIASQHGLAVHVTNRGAQGYSVWQELNLLEEQLANGYRPDVVVLYDGINELYVQAATGTTSTPSNIKAREYETAILQSEQKAATSAGSQSLLARAYDSYANTSALVRMVRVITGHQSVSSPGQVDNIIWDPDQSLSTAEVRGRDAAAIHNQAVSIIEALGAQYHFRLVSFWQPLLYSKTPIPSESNVAGLWGETPSAWRAMDAAARSNLRAPEIDLSGALNHSTAPVMIDFMHTNEAGAQEVANAMFPYIDPVLTAAAHGSQP
jgi:lysophospholipase L1-like esterase